MASRDPTVIGEGPVSWSMEFAIPGKKLHLLKNNLSRVRKLFNVDVSLSNSFKRNDVEMQWIGIKGGDATADEMKNAKSYIVSMTNPEACICLENISLQDYNNTADEVESSTTAFLSLKGRCVEIKGSELAVVLAQSMLESIQQDNRAASADPKSSNQQTKPIQSTQQSSSRTDPMPYLHHSCLDQPCLSDTVPLSEDTVVKQIAWTGSNPSRLSPPPSSSLSLNRNKNLRISNNSKQNQQRDTKASSDQYQYLISLGLKHKFDMTVINEGLKGCDMNEVVRPAEFLERLANIRQLLQRLSGVEKRGSDSHSHGAESSLSSARDHLGRDNSDHSVILIDSDGEEDDDDNDFDEGDPAILISSDEENQEIVQPPLQAQKAKAKKKKKKKKQGDGSGNPAPPLPKPVAVGVRQTNNQPLASTSAAAASLGPAPSQSVSGKRKLRYIIIDGSNVAMAHGEGKIYSVPGIQICLDYFVSKGHKVTIFVPETRRYANNTIPISRKDLLEKMSEQGYLKFTPARRMPAGRIIASYDDRFILNLAEAEQGIVVSNDQYRDLMYSKPSYKEIIETRLLPFMFVNDHFMPPDDPLGRTGPCLEDFLRMPGHAASANTGNPGFNGFRRGYEQFKPVSTEKEKKAAYAQNFQAAKQKTHEEIEKRKNEEAWASHMKRDVGRDVTDGGDAVTLPVNVRSAEQSQKLFGYLSSMFPEPDQQERLLTILHNHPAETDITRLSNYVLNAL